MTERTYYTHFDSPVGRLLLIASSGGLERIVFHSGKARVRPEQGWLEAEDPFQEVIRQLEAYFSGRLREFTVSLCPKGTPFQLGVWRQLSGIPYGETATYAEIARRMGNPKAVRAVGLANGRNPLPIVVPCHRVIGSDGSLTGYGGGLKTKAALLELERKGAPCPKGG